MQIDPGVLAFYQRGLERARLDAGPGLLELLRTRDVLSRVLPRPPATILDVGGGPGAHATWLASSGYDVRLLDPVPLHVDQARQLGIDARLGDARRLDEPDGGWDAVLLLGPLYHLTERAERVRALGEAVRVTRPGGVVVAATISRYAPLWDTLRQGRYGEPDVAARVDASVATGVHRPAPEAGLFTTAYFHHPDEIVAEFEGAGLLHATRYAVEGPAAFMGNLEELLADDASAATLLHAVRSVEGEPSLLGATGHLLTCGQVRLS